MTFPFVASIMTRNCGPRPAREQPLVLGIVCQPGHGSGRAGRPARLDLERAGIDHHDVVFFLVVVEQRPLSVHDAGLGGAAEIHHLHNGLLHRIDHGQVLAVAV